MTITAKASRADADPGLPDAATRVRDLILGFVVSRAVQVAAELDLAAHLRDGGKDSVELAALCGAHAPTLSRLLRMLVSIGVFVENHGRFANNALSDLLRGDVPHSMRAWARMFGSDSHWSSAQALMHSAQTGEAAFQHVFKEELFTHLSRHPEKARLFDEAMVSGSELMNRAIIDAYDFSGFTAAHRCRRRLWQHALRDSHAASKSKGHTLRSSSRGRESRGVRSGEGTASAVLYGCRKFSRKRSERSRRVLHEAHHSRLGR